MLTFFGGFCIRRRFEHLCHMDRATFFFCSFLLNTKAFTRLANYNPLKRFLQELLAY